MSNLCILRQIPTTLLQTVLSTRNNFVFNKCNKVFYITSKYDLDLTVKGVSLQNYIKKLEQEYEGFLSLNSFTSNTRFQKLRPLIESLKERKVIVENILNLSELLNEKDTDIRKLAEEEKVSFENKIKEIDEKLLEAILPSDKEDECDSIVLEINAGVGGQEAMLFASELFQMYCNFADHQGM